MRQTKETGSPGRPARTTQKINSHRFGSVTNNKGYIGLDFYYLGERIRAGFNGLRHTERNAREARIFLDRIGTQMQNHTFRFREHFPDHPKAIKLAEREGSPTIMPGEIRLKDYVKQFLDENFDLLSRGQKVDILSHLKAHIMPRFGHFTFAELTHKLLKDFVRDLQLGKTTTRKPLKGATIRNVLSTFRKIVNEAVDDYEWEDWIDPFEKLKLPSKNPKRQEPLTLEEWNLIKAQLAPWYVTYFSFALLTGMRTSEICALKWEDVTDEVIQVRRTIVKGVLQETTKTEKSRRDILLREPIRRLLEAQKQVLAKLAPNSEFVFVSRTGRPFSVHHHGHVWRDARARGSEAQETLYTPAHDDQPCNQVRRRPSMAQNADRPYRHVNVCQALLAVHQHPGSARRI